MRLKRLFSGVLASLLATTLVMTDVAGGVTAASANSESQGVVLNGLVADDDPGRLGTKTVIMSSAAPTTVSYRLVPQYTQSYAAGVKVRLYLPSLKYVDGKYEVTTRDEAPTAMGVQGEVRSGGGWIVHTPGKVKGGYIELEYEGNLASGSNPAFELVLSTYNDGSTGPYGGVPEGFQFSINGFVSYEQFGGDESKAWSTPGLFDEESKITVIASDLKWEPAISAFAPGGGSTSVPMWDRFQYFDYVYKLQNTSTNPASNIEAYSVNLQLQTTENINGIIPTDINRWTFTGRGNAPTMNDNADYAEGQFIGVPGEGGVLIYDVTDVYQTAGWDGTTGLGDPIPYSYDGAGMVTIDRTHGEGRDKVTPGSERVYLVKLPMSRQGFPNIPTTYNVDAITNIVLGEKTNWSKTKTALREVLPPTYAFDFTHTPEKPEPVYGLSTYTQIEGMKNTSNVPVFTPSIEYSTVEDFRHSDIVYLIDESNVDRFKDVTLAYTYMVKSGEDIVERKIEVKPTFVEDPTSAGRMRAVFDVSAVNDAESWDGKFHFTNLDDRLEPGEPVPLTIQLHGVPMEVKTMTFPAVTTYVEKYASNEEYTAPTTYTEVPHTVQRDAVMDVILPNEVFPRDAVRIDGAATDDESYKYVAWGSTPTLGFNFGTNNETAQTSKHTITVNTSTTEAVRDAHMVIKPELFAAGEITSITVVDLDGKETAVDLEGRDLTQAFTVELENGFSQIVVETGEFTTNDAQNFIDVIGTIDAGLKTTHTVKVESETYQGAPYNKTNKTSATGYMGINLPGDLNPGVSIVGIYGERRTATSTTIPYEAAVSAEYRVTTGGVNAPEWTYTITEDAPTKMPDDPTESKGVLVGEKLTVSAELLVAASDVVVTFTDDNDETEAFPVDAENAVIDYADITLKGEITKIVLSGKNLSLASSTPVVTIDYDSQIDMGQSQTLRAKFLGTATKPYTEDKTASTAHPINVQETRTTIEVEGVNQVEKAPGAGSTYDQWVDRQRTCGYNCTMTDWTLDQGYKTLGGFVTSLTRPTGVNHNNDQTTVIDVNLPHTQFDTYYVKIRKDIKPYLQTVDLYRMVDGKEELWKTIPASEWVENTTEGKDFWRINTAQPTNDGAALFETKASTTDADHPYYKEPFADDVVPTQPISRVTVTLKFERENLAATPQLAGLTSRVVEYMGRFYETSEEGKKATTSRVEDTFGKRFPITRNHVPTPVYSLVHYPFAQAETGVHDKVSTDRKVVTMGTESHYLGNIWNVANQRYGSWHWPHGADINVPVWTESDEWMMSYYNKGLATFHDKLIYKFTYPATPDKDETYNFDPTKITVTNTNTLKYFTGLTIFAAEDTSVTLELTKEERDAIIAKGSFVATYDNTREAGFYAVGNGDYVVSLGEGVYPTGFEAVFEEIDGFGDKTTELQGEPKDTLGSGLTSEIDIRISGLVNGNKDLVGKTELIRDPNDSDRKVTSTSTGTLIGYTPKLGGTLDMSFDKLYVADYAADGVTPNTTTTQVGMRNSSEADISSFQMTMHVDPNFRSQKVEIPASIFDGTTGDWKATAVSLATPNGTVPIPLDRFELKGDKYVLNIDALYEGDDALLTASHQKVTAGGTSWLEIRDIDRVIVDFAAAKGGVVMWGSTSIADQRALEDEQGVAEADRKVMPQRMIPGSYIFLTGDYVDEAVSKDGVEKWTGEREGWDSKPTDRGQNWVTDSDDDYQTDWTVSATNLKTPLSIYTPAATTGNVGTKPKLTIHRIGESPRVNHRVVDFQLRGAHLDNNLVLKTDEFPFDADTNAHVANTDLVVGDTTKILYEIRNAAAVGDESRNPLFDPSAHFTAPTGMKITGIQVVTPESVSALHLAIAGLGRTTQSLTADQFVINDTANPDKSRSVQFSTTLLAQESVWVYVQYEAINDFSDKLEDTEGKSVVVRSYATPGLQHHLQLTDAKAQSNFDKHYGVDASSGSTEDYNKDGWDETSIGVAATYQYASADVLDIEKKFDVESLSGTPMTITVDKMSNQIGHDNTHMLVDMVFDTNQRGFEMTEMPVPTHVAGYDAPVVTHVYINETWVDYVEGTHDLADINGMRVDYGIVPAYMKDGNENLVDFQVPSFQIKGIAHWQNYKGVSTKSSEIRSTINMALTHHNSAADGNPEVARYTVSDVHVSTVYKGLHDVELNLQSFDTEDEALVEYSDAQAPKVGKTSYIPGETIWNKISVRNANTPASSNTGRGKAPVLDPVIYDKVPEYMTAELMDKFVSEDGTVDVEGAVAADLLVIKHFDKDGAVIDGAALPTVTVTDIEGLDIAGAQQFANDRHNDRHGKLSTEEPVNTEVNPAEKIDFKLFTYSFEQDLGRGERFEVMYPAKIRTKDLPYATYKDGNRPVWAPMLGWYDSNDMLSSNAHTYDMDMAALLHDVGFSGTRSHEMTEAEFLSDSTSWLPGQNRERLEPGSYWKRIETYYDASANSQYTHNVEMVEEVSNQLRETDESGDPVDQNWRYAMVARVNDGVVKHIAPSVNQEGATREERVLWAQDNLQLRRAWLYGASEFRPETMRETPNATGMTRMPDESNVNFIEHDGTLDRTENGTGVLISSRYTGDNYTYAVQLDEKLDVRLHAANLGDRAIESGVEYTEILPVGFTPFAEDGSLLGVQAFSGNGVLGADSADTALSEKITTLGTSGVVTVEIVQSPTNDKGLRAPAQNQEAGTYKTATTEHGVPYVVKIKVATPLKGMFLSNSSTVESKHQYVDLSVRVDGQAKLKSGEFYYWYDQLSVTSIDAEPYMALYSKEYGAFSTADNRHNIGRHVNDSIWNGIDISNLRWYHYPSYDTYYSFEPHGQYIRGLNAQGTATNNTVEADTDEMQARPVLVTGDQIIERKPTLRVWNDFSKDEYLDGYAQTAQDFTTELHDRFTIHATVENQQIEAQSAYHHDTNKASSTDRQVSTYGYHEKWESQHQTIGGGRGSWFDPTVTVAYPFGIVPVLTNGESARYDGDVAAQQNVAFTAAINEVAYNKRTQIADVTEHLDVRVERIKSDQGERYVLFFTIKDNDAAREALREVKYGQSLVVSPKAMTVDMPPYTADETIENQRQFQNVLTFANTEVDVFEPMVSSKYATGSLPGKPTAVDYYRTDTYGANGRKAIYDRLISPTGTYLQSAQIDMHVAGEWKVAADTLLADVVQASETNFGAYGGSRIVMRYPAVVNTTTVDEYDNGDFADIELVAAAGKFWVSTDVHNKPVGTGTDYNKLLNVAKIHNSRFVVTSYVTSFAEKTGDVKIFVDGETLDRKAFEDRGWTVEAVTEDERKEDTSERQTVRWIVTPPAPAEGVAKGRLDSDDSFKLLQEYQLVDGFREDTAAGGKWVSDDFKIDTYVSLITDDTALAPTQATRDDFVVQPLEPIRYETLVAESTKGDDIDGDDKATGFLAQNQTVIEVAKPQGEVRINTARPRMEYSNGSVGDPYFNTDDVIEYLVTHAKNTGSGLKEMVIDSMLPANSTKDSTFNVATREIRTTLEYVSSGEWMFPKAILDRIEAANKSIDDVYEVEVYVSATEAEDGHADGEWVSLGKSSATKNTVFEVPADQQENRHAVRVVLRSLDADFLVPTNARLAIDADLDADGKQEITEVDPNNKGFLYRDKVDAEGNPAKDEDGKIIREPIAFHAGVTDAAIKIGINAKSDVKQTAFIYNEAELWGNYVADAYVMLDDDQVRSYLTPSRPVVNVFHSALYYRSDAERPSGDPGKWGWSDNITVNPQASQHMKMRGEVINASEDMWSEEESITYAQDRLINPVMTFELPSVMAVDEKRFNYVANADLTAEHPLHDDYRSRYALSPEDQAYSWTWKLVGADGGPADDRSFLEHVDIHVGAWDGSDRNLVTVWFKGEVLPGDRIVVDFIGLIDQFVPGTSAQDRKSRVFVTNNTGLVQPLNSDWNLMEQNPGHRLGYESDRLDFDDNGLLNDRLVFNEQTLFSFEVFDNFGKQKKAYSDLNQAGTVHPNATPVREGGTFSFSLTLDNTREQNDAPYVFPSMYDVLPHVGDSDIQYGPVKPENLRNSKGSSVVDLDSFVLSREGATGKTYAANEYTIFVGPFSKSGNTVVAHDKFISPADSKSGAFFDSLGTGSTNSSVRDQYFVKLADLKAAVATKPELLDELKTVLVLFNKSGEQLPGQHKMKLTYDLKAPINAPALIESRGAEENFNDYAQWNSFVGTQKKDGFIPQESNRAGAYITERADRVSIGNYVWSDTNYDGEFTGEGETITDVNGRKLLVPGEGQADPGINGVKVSLLTEGGHYADELGNPIKQVGGKWLVVDDATGETFIDEIGQTRESTGPMVTTTQNDVHGRAGYYVFSNIAEGTYRVMFEMPKGYERHWATTDVMTSGAKVNVFEPTVAADVQVTNDKSLLKVVTSAETLTTETKDEVRMGFDLPVGEWLEFGGVVFNDANRDGKVGSDSKLSGYTVELLNEAGEVVTDLKGEPYSKVTANDGKYLFRVLPVPGVFSLKVTYPEGKNFISTPVTPIMHAGHPFAQTDDNDAFAQKVEGGRVIRTNDFRYNQVDLSKHFANNTQFLGVNFGFYERKTTAVLGDRVWNDLNRNGIQDLGEPGVAGQELLLERFVQDASGEWVKDETFKRTTTKSGDDGYYAFKDVVAYEAKDGSDVEYRFQVRVEDGKLAKGYTFTDGLVGDDIQVDSDFNRKGTIGNQLISLVEIEEGVRIAVDNTTVDLGLYSTAKGAISGEIFIDAEEDGLKTGDKLADERFTVMLQVSNDRGATWTNVAKQQVTGVNQYKFEGLEIFNDADGVNKPNEYRVVVTQVPLWFEITDKKVGDDQAIDSDFTEIGREGTYTVVSDTYFLGEFFLDEDKADEYFPINTREAIDFENIDLGLIEPKVVIGGMMWDDKNANGVQDAGEAPIAGEEVVLWEEVDGKWIKVDSGNGIFGWFLNLLGVEQPVTQKTDENGEYRFKVSPLHYEDEEAGNHLDARKYKVTVERDAWQSWSPFQQGDDKSIDSDVITPATEFGYELTGVSALFDVIDEKDGKAVPTSLRDDVEMDLGVTTFDKQITIGGLVWDDVNHDGIQTEGEELIEGQVVLLQEKIDGEWVAVADLEGYATKTTGANGRYSFLVEPAVYDRNASNFLEMREYRVISERLGNQLWSPAGQGEDKTLDSNIHDNAAGVKPQLGGYSDQFTIGEVDAATGWADAASFRDDREMDLGLTTYPPTIEIGGIVWEDTNRDGIQQAGEKTYAGQTITLQEKVNGEWLAIEDVNGVGEITTAADGVYVFEVAPTYFEESHPLFLTEREYRVVSDRLGNQTWSPAEQGEDKTLDSNIVWNGGKPELHAETPAFVVGDMVEGQMDVSTIRDDREMDMGLTTFASTIEIGGRAWGDVNFDGIQQEAEESIEGQVVVLQEKIDGEWVNVEDVNGLGSQPTGADGRYTFVVEPTHYLEEHPLFMQLREYRVISEREGFQAWSPIGQGEDATLDSNVTGNGEKPEHIGYSNLFEIADLAADGRIDVSTVRDDIEMDMGLATYDTSIVIGGRAWDDVNFDGIQQETEESIEGQVVVLQEKIAGEWVNVEDLNGLGSMPTDAEGRYEFVVAPTFYEEDHARYLEVREYRVVSDRLGNQAWSPVHQGEDDTLDSNITGDDTKPEHRGYSDLFVISDALDLGRIDISSVRNDIEMDMGLATYDTSIVIGGRAWDDADFDGIQQDAEESIVGQVVTLQEKVNDEWINVEDLNGLGSMPTDEAGRYEFVVAPTFYEEDHERYLEVREYRVISERLGNQAWSPIAQGEDTTLDSNVAGNGEKPEHIGYSELFVIGDALESGRLDISTVRDDIEMDMGLKTHATSIVIGGRAWEDANVDGIQNEDELSIAGQVVTLQEKSNGEWVTIEDLNGVSEMETNEEGRYEFVVAPTYYEEDHELYLQARDYRVTSERLGFQRWSPEHMGEDTTLDSDMLDEKRHRAFSAYFVVADIDDESGRVLIESVRDDLEMDMGLKTYEDRVKIGGTVWVDDYADGLMQSDERPMSGQEITLQEYIDGVWVEVQDVNGDSEMVTDENGYYEFEVLPTRYEEDGSGYLHIRDYRTVMDVPANHRLSSGAAVTATQVGAMAHSKVSEIAEMDEESGLVVLGSYNDDLVLDYPYVVIPLALTGGTIAAWALSLAGGAILVGFFLIFLKRRRREEEEVEARA